MSTTLTWPGRGAVQAAPARDSATLTVHQTLLERDGGGWVVVASHVSTPEGIHGAVDGGPAASCIAPPPSGLFEVAGAAEAVDIFLLPPLLHVLQALAVAPEPGWTAVVADGGVRSELLVRLATECGARRLVRVVDSPMPSRSTGTDVVLDLHAGDNADRLAALVTPGGPVVAFETRGEPAAVLAILATLPPRSHLVLLEAAPSPAQAAVNFYRDVHRKNVTLHGIPRPIPRTNGDMERALRILRHRLADGRFPGITRVTAAAGAEPAAGDAALLVLAWP